MAAVNNNRNVVNCLLVDEQPRSERGKKGQHKVLNGLPCNYNSFKNILSKVYPSESDDTCLWYSDDEGDQVIISTDEEYFEAIKISKEKFGHQLLFHFDNNKKVSEKQINKISESGDTHVSQSDDNPPTWFLNYMEGFKEKLVHEISTKVLDTMSKKSDADTVSMDAHKEVCLSERIDEVSSQNDNVLEQTDEGIVNGASHALPELDEPMKDTAMENKNARATWYDSLEEEVCWTIRREMLEKRLLKKRAELRQLQRMRRERELRDTPRYRDRDIKRRLERVVQPMSPFVLRAVSTQLAQDLTQHDEANVAVGNQVPQGRPSLYPVAQWVQNTPPTKPDDFEAINKDFDDYERLMDIMASDHNPNQIGLLPSIIPPVTVTRMVPQTTVTRMVPPITVTRMVPPTVTRMVPPITVTPMVPPIAVTPMVPPVVLTPMELPVPEFESFTPMVLPQTECVTVTSTTFTPVSPNAPTQQRQETAPPCTQVEKHVTTATAPSMDDIPTVSILPDAIVTGAVSAVSSAFTTAGAVFSRLRSTPPEVSKFQGDEDLLFEMGFEDRPLNALLLLKHKNNIQKVIEVLLTWNNACD